jgi:serine protease Do
MVVHLKTLLPVAALVLAGCGGLNVQEVPLQDLAGAPAQNAQPAPVGFREIRFAIPTGTPTVSQSPKGLLGLLVCDWPYTMVQTGMRSRSFPDDNLKDIFLNTLRGQGYDVTGDPGRFFDEEEDEMRTAYAVGGQITDIKIDICKRSNLWGIDRGGTGEAYVSINWSVFDMLGRKTVLKTTTQGYGRLENPNDEALQLLFESAAESAIHNLGADEAFNRLVFIGEEPENAPGTIADINELPVGLFDPGEKVDLSNIPVSKQSVHGRLEQIEKTVVMIEAGASHGSGFFISRGGHILTNAHVVGNAARVRVVTSGKQEKLRGEVLRIDRRRDVALIRLEEIPASFTISTLPLRLEEPAVGEEVYAIGAPRRKQLQDTVTKGIVSAHRYDRREKQPYIQADVDIYAGNSGGPLIDAHGNIIGLAALGFMVSDDTLGGLNWFIPIGDALEKLDIGFVKAL